MVINGVQYSKLLVTEILFRGNHNIRTDSVDNVLVAPWINHIVTSNLGYDLSYLPDGTY